MPLCTPQQTPFGGCDRCSAPSICCGKRDTRIFTLPANRRATKNGRPRRQRQTYQMDCTASIASCTILSGATPKATTSPTRQMPARRVPTAGAGAAASAGAASV